MLHIYTNFGKTHEMRANISTAIQFVKFYINLISLKVLSYDGLEKRMWQKKKLKKIKYQNVIGNDLFFRKTTESYISTIEIFRK